MNINMTSIFQIALAIFAGVAVAHQPGINARFAQATPSPVYGGVINFVCGAVVMVVIALVMRLPPPTISKLGGLPWWAWTGGALGAFFVTTALVLVPKVGATQYLACMIAGQLVGSVIIDHFGHLGLAVHPFSVGRAVGILLLIAGLVCIKLY